MTLTGKQIRDLAVAAGFPFDENLMPADDADEMETEITIAAGPSEGVTDDDGKVEHYDYVAYYSEYPDEGCIPLGDPVTA